MAKMRWGSNIDWDELEGAEYSEDEFDDYEGPLPPHNAILSGYIKKLWATTSSNGDPMIKALFIADWNEGERQVYNGAPLWDNILFTMPQVKFRWQPWLDALDITLDDLNRRTVVGDEENQGDVITKIGAVRFDGKEPVEVRVKTIREKYGDETQAKVGKWLPPADAEDADAEDDREDDDWADEPDDGGDWE